MGAAPALAATSASADASTPSVICCEGGGHYVTWQNRADALYLLDFKCYCQPHMMEGVPPL